MVQCRRVGVTVEDERIARWLRPVRKGQPVIVVATKCENDAGEDVADEAARLGFGRCGFILGLVSGSEF